MTCEVEYCIYNKRRTCILERIEITAMGTCDSCELVEVPKEIIHKSKVRRLKVIEAYVAKVDEE